MLGRDGDSPRHISARLDFECAGLRAEIAGFLAQHPYRVQLDHDSETGKYRIWHDGTGAPIPEGIFSAAERFFSHLPDAYERGYGDPRTDWEALPLVQGRIGEVLEPVLLEGKTRLNFCDGRPTFGNSCPICGPFRDQQVIAGGVVYPPDTEIEFIPVFEIAFQEGGGLAGPLGGRVVIDLANALCVEVREAVANQPRLG